LTSPLEKQVIRVTITAVKNLNVIMATGNVGEQGNYKSVRKVDKFANKNILLNVTDYSNTQTFDFEI